MPRTAAAPLGVWSVEANNARIAALGGVATLAAIAQSIAPITHHFRRDLLAFCKATGLLPHPQLLPFHPDEEDPTTNGELLTPGAGPVAWDLAEIDTIHVKNWRLDDGSFAGLCFALQHCPIIHTVVFFNVQLTADQVETLCRLIPQTSVTRFHLDWNASLESDRDDSMLPPPSVFTELLAPTSNVSALSLRRCGLTTAHAVAIAQALQAKPNGSSKLEMLDLFDNPQIGDDGAIALAYALPFTPSLQSLSLGNTGLSGVAAHVLVEVLGPKYVAPPALLRYLEDAEPRIQAELDQAKKAKKKLDRAGAIHNLGLPILETVDDVPYAVGNTTLRDLILSGNDLITETAVLAMDAVLQKLPTASSLQRIKLQRIPALHAFAAHNTLSRILHL